MQFLKKRLEDYNEAEQNPAEIRQDPANEGAKAVEGERAPSLVAEGTVMEPTQPQPSVGLTRGQLDRASQESKYPPQGGQTEEELEAEVERDIGFGETTSGMAAKQDKHAPPTGGETPREVGTAEVTPHPLSSKQLPETRKRRLPC